MGFWLEKILLTNDPPVSLAIVNGVSKIFEITVIVPVYTSFVSISHNIRSSIKGSILIAMYLFFAWRNVSCLTITELVLDPVIVFFLSCIEVREAYLLCDGERESENKQNKKEDDSSKSAWDDVELSLKIQLTRL